MLSQLRHWTLLVNYYQLSNDSARMEAHRMFGFQYLLTKAACRSVLSILGGAALLVEAKNINSAFATARLLLLIRKARTSRLQECREYFLFMQDGKSRAPER
jgi:hypothetical protein